MIRVLVAVLWRPQPHREYAHEIVTAHYARILPDADILDVDTDHDPFCLAACRNRGVRIAENSGYDVVVLADADTLPEAKPLRTAIEQAAYSRFVHLPYTEYRSLREDGTRQYLAGTPLEDCNHMVVDFACSGVLVTTPATWWSCGGQDETMRGWGMEDVAFLVAHRTILGAEFPRHAGAVYALHHESAVKDGPQYDANVARYQRYLDAAGDPAAMQALIAERTDAVTCEKSASVTGG